MSAATLQVFSTPTCGPCKAIKKTLAADGIHFEPIDLTEDPEALALLKRVLNVPMVQTPIFRWKGEYLDISHLPRIRDEAKAAL